MDSGALYAMIFGSEKFEPLIGEVKLASQMSQADEASKVSGNFETFSSCTGTTTTHQFPPEEARSSMCSKSCAKASAVC